MTTNHPIPEPSPFVISASLADEPQDIKSTRLNPKQLADWRERAEQAKYIPDHTIITALIDDLEDTRAAHDHEKLINAGLFADVDAAQEFSQCVLRWVDDAKICDSECRSIVANHPFLVALRAPDPP